jgi:hypothetical protein
MTYTVLSSRMDWPAGTVLSTADLSGCNIEHLVATGHLAVTAVPRFIKKGKPVDPDPVDELADEPEEQE